MGVQPSTDQAMLFAFDADAVDGRTRVTGERIAAHRNRVAGAGNSHGQVLAGKRRRQRAVVIGCEANRQHRWTFPARFADPQRAKSFPPRLDSDGRCGLGRGAVVRLQHVTE